jgi:hypothetical protein
MAHRVVEPELLDALPGDDPEARRSRRDLRRLNGWMRNRKHVLGAIHGLRQAPANIVEVGTGDGTFMLSMARRLRWKHPVRLTMLDMQPVLSGETLEGFAHLGWETEVREEKIQDWLSERAGRAERIDLVLGNLFWHHFSDEELRECFAKISGICRAFIACEPRRWLPAQISTRLLWGIGCSRVTMHDARVSVAAGFRDSELSALWPAGSEMKVQEYEGGWASHLFVAERK